MAGTLKINRADILAAYTTWVRRQRRTPERFGSREEYQALSVKDAAVAYTDYMMDLLTKRAAAK